MLKLPSRDIRHMAIVCYLIFAYVVKLSSLLLDLHTPIIKRQIQDMTVDLG